jgi:hypothetical protein
MKAALGRACIRVTIESPVDIRAIDVVKRIHSPFAPLDIESRGVSVSEAVGETDLQFRGCDDVIVRYCIGQRFEFEPEITNTLEGRQIYRTELTGTVSVAHTASR